MIGIGCVSPSSTTPAKTPSSATKLPSYAYTNPTTLSAYTFATTNPAMLEVIPCYCGCGGHTNHLSLKDCFINPDGTYDDHASYCDTCVGENIKVQDYLNQGKTIKEIRTLIDSEYGAKYPGMGTNTPPIA
jgi:hypothetical protein